MRCNDRVGGHENKCDEILAFLVAFFKTMGQNEDKDGYKQQSRGIVAGTSIPESVHPFVSTTAADEN